VGEWSTLVQRLRSNGVHFLVPHCQPEMVAYELSMIASGTDCRMCIASLGSLLEGVHMMQIPFPKALPFAASELFPATLAASETLLKVRGTTPIRQLGSNPKRSSSLQSSPVASKAPLGKGWETHIDDIPPLARRRASAIAVLCVYYAGIALTMLPHQRVLPRWAGRGEIGEQEKQELLLCSW
jgi:hypothetical protein